MFNDTLNAVEIPDLHWQARSRTSPLVLPGQPYWQLTNSFYWVGDLAKVHIAGQNNHYEVALILWEPGDKSPRVGWINNETHKTKQHPSLAAAMVAVMSLLASSEFVEELAQYQYCADNVSCNLLCECVTLMDALAS